MEENNKESSKKIGIIVCIILILLIGIISIFLINSKTYTVTISNGDSSYTLKVKKNKLVEEPTEPYKEGYKFIGWYYNGSLFDFDTKVKENIKLVAKYEKDYNYKKITTTTKTTTTTSSATTTTTTTTAKNKYNSSYKNTTKKATYNTTVATQAPATTTKPTTKSTTKAVTYSYKAVEIKESSIGQYYIYVVNNITGSYVSGTVKITYKNGASETVNIPSTGYKIVWSTVSSVSEVRGS